MALRSKSGKSDGFPAALQEAKQDQLLIRYYTWFRGQTQVGGPNADQIRARLVAWKSETGEPYGFVIFWIHTYWLTLAVAIRDWGADGVTPLVESFKKRWPGKSEVIQELSRQFVEFKEPLSGANWMWCDEGEMTRRSRLPAKKNMPAEGEALHYPGKAWERTPVMEKAIAHIKATLAPYAGKIPRRPQPKNPYKPGEPPAHVEGFSTMGAVAAKTVPRDIEAERQALLSTPEGESFTDFWQGFHAGPDAGKERKPSSEMPPDPATVLPPGAVEGEVTPVPPPSGPSPLQQELIERQKRKTAGLPEHPPAENTETAEDWAKDMPDPFADD